jgi:hypothetical protein
VARSKNIRIPVALVPEGTEPERAMEWYSGHLLTADGFGHALADLIINAAHKQEMVLVAEDFLADVADPFHDREPSEAFSYGGSIYYYANVAADPAPIVRCLEWARASTSNAFLVSGHQLNYSRRQEITHSELAELVEATVMVIVDAYDGESYMLAEARRSNDMTEPRLLAF